MKRSIIVLVSFFAFFVTHAVELALFDQNHYDGWTYTRDNMILNTDDISHNRIVLYHFGSGIDYTLISPLIGNVGCDTVDVDITAYSTTYSSSVYNSIKGSPTIEILDEEGNVVKSEFHLFTDVAFERKFVISFDMRDVTIPNYRVRIACWNADKNSVLAIRKVVVDGVGLPVNADVNGDGNITAADVTALYDYLLNNDATGIVNGDVNNDGIITAADVTVVYSVMLEE